MDFGRDSTSQEIRQVIEVAEASVLSSSGSDIVIDLDFTNVPMPPEEDSEP